MKKKKHKHRTEKPNQKGKPPNEAKVIYKVLLTKETSMIICVFIIAVSNVIIELIAVGLV